MHLFLYGSVLPNVCDSTAVSCSVTGEGPGVHNVLHFPGIFVKGDLIPIFFIANKGKSAHLLQLLCLLSW